MDDSSEGVILVMGVTGAGKSYFLNQLKSQSVQEGHSLFAETQGCQAVQIFLDDEDEKRSITVVDTPGFDDTERPQAEILAEITDYLAAQHISGLPLRGILYLHKITENRMTGTSRTYLKLLEDLVGDDALKNVILVTSMWNMLRPQDRRVAVQREQQLLDNFWSPMVEKGSYVAQFDGTPDSAYALVFQLAGKQSVVLDIQKEIVDGDCSILETAAGTTLVHQLEKDHEAYQLKLFELDDQLDHEMRAQPRDRDKIRQLKEEKQQVEKVLHQMSQSVDRMKIHPGSPMRQRIMQAMRESGKAAAMALGLVLNLTYFAVQLGMGM
ncbi:P-loop containing nucleoside triphosphate hydrolase protein [Dactylonectria macrodidyma]|uniref:P-loop containing nucleoside triphosphate hydrolase protein n=1 Tax=Dactylonectria macrodidyma TaxID=307937 RepID=A0A9P9DYG2_9HYPO|nr:P-loop containing nucleoside triphosphate hydrolase protein [Dactylonectria macrodidyma]